ncbi:ankyrin protein unc44 [Fusarium heterosporum]|uniref:Ankyrin protein unc44 n=1 Tax=Fusarium heterosporum TaxID=42747 RepID=A0A8H5WGF5_FUSHE|nr:ankyrin protein unc44 [Fusarium heterosporum]
MHRMNALRPVYAQEGRLDIIKKAHEHGADISLAGTIEYGQKASPLHYAIEHGHRDIVEYLVETGVDPHVLSAGLCIFYMDEAVVNPYVFHTAILHSYVEGTVQLLVEKLGAYWSFRDTPALDEIYLDEHDEDGEYDKDFKKLADLFINLPRRQSAIDTLQNALKWKHSELATRILKRPDFDDTFTERH